MPEIYGSQYGSEPYGSGTVIDGFPRAFPLNPRPGDEDVLADATIELVMEVDLVEPWSIDVDHGSGFERALTYSGGAVFDAAYDGPSSFVSISSNWIEVVIDKVDAFDPFDEVTLRINAQDAEGNDIVIV